MKNVRRVCLYAKQMQLVCSAIEQCAAALDPCLAEEDDPVIAQLLFDQLEHGQKLILALTEAIMNGADDLSPGQSPQPGRNLEEIADAGTPASPASKSPLVRKTDGPGSNPAGAATVSIAAPLNGTYTARNSSDGKDVYTAVLTEEVRKNDKKH